MLSADQLHCCFCLYAFSGLCLPTGYVKLRWSRVYRLHMAVCELLTALHGATVFANAVSPGVSMSERCYSIYASIVITEGACKIIACHVFQRRFAEYLRRWDVLMERDCSEELNEAKEKNARSMRRLTYAVFFFMVALMIPWGSLPLEIKWLSYLFPSLSESYNFVAIPAKFPFDPLTSPNFEVVTIFQGIAGVPINAGLTAYDCMLFGLLSCVVVELEQLKKDLGELFCTTVSSEDLRRSRMKKWVARHNNLVSLTRSLNQLYSPLLLVKFTFDILILCLGAFLVSSNSATKFEVVCSILYSSTTVFQLYILCSLGEDITRLSSSLADIAFGQQWFVASPDMCASFKIIIENTKVPLKISAYGTFPLSVETFKSVLKTAYSYFMFLNGIK